MRDNLPTILGIHYLRIDPSACLIADGRIVAMAEEERFTREKHAEGKFPENAIKFCLQQAKIGLGDVDYIAIGWDITAYPLKMAEHYLRTWHKWPTKDEKTLNWEINSLRKYSGDAYVKKIRNQLMAAGFNENDIPTMVFRPHHYCHAISAYLASGFNEANIVTVDGHGEENCTVLWEARGREIRKLREFNIPHSLGWFYAAFTRFVGFKIYDGEGKCMGLAPYGHPNKKLERAVNEILRIGSDAYEVDPTYLFYSKRTIADEFSDKFAQAFGEYRKTDKDEIRDEHKDAAYEAQRRLEEAAVMLTRSVVKQTKLRNICLAGGVALNCKMNGVVHRLDEIDNIFIQPVSGDDGSVLGAAMAIYLENGLPIDGFRMDHVYFGPEYTNQDIEAVLKAHDLEYGRPAEIEKETARLISDGSIVGWFQGRMEVGPRALGNRSILADPRNPKSKDIVNQKVKFREPWRPFCPSIMYEHADEYLVKSCYHPFMILTFIVNEEKTKEIPSVVHVDNTARPQTVRKDVNPRYWSLLNEFYRITNVPVLLNTSFNIKGDPIVCTPEDAVECYEKTGLDALAIGDYLVTK
jgi:carbamoyltransferase